MKNEHASKDDVNIFFWTADPKSVIIKWTSNSPNSPSSLTYVFSHVESASYIVNVVKHRSDISTSAVTFPVNLIRILDSWLDKKMLEDLEVLIDVKKQN